MTSSNASTEISPSISPMRKRPKAAPPTITKVIVSARKAYKRRSGGAASRAPRDVMSRGSNGQARRPWAIEIQAVRCTLFDQSVLSSNRRRTREDLEEPLGESGQKIGKAQGREKECT